jgi:HTH-type transcriptional regulator / antitoxin HipB
MDIITAMKVNKEEKLAVIIKKSRKLAGLTQSELAKKAGVGKTLIFNLEHGSLNVSFENLLKVLKVLNIKIDYLLPFQSIEDEN